MARSCDRSDAGARDLQCSITLQTSIPRSSRHVKSSLSLKVLLQASHGAQFAFRRKRHSSGVRAFVGYASHPCRTVLDRRCGNAVWATWNLREDRKEHPRCIPRCSLPNQKTGRRAPKPGTNTGAPPVTSSLRSPSTSPGRGDQRMALTMLKAALMLPNGWPGPRRPWPAGARR